MQGTRTEENRLARRALDDATLLSRLGALVTCERATTAKLLWHLAEVDVRGLYRDEGYSALFEYCVKALHMSEGEASLRIRAARLSRRFPVVLAKVERGELHLSALRALAPVLTEDNHRVLLSQATHKTRREVEQMLADRAPKPDAKSAMRRLPSARPSQDRSETTACAHVTRPAAAQSLALTMSGGGPALCQPSVSHPVSSSLATPCKPAPSVAPNRRSERRGEATPLGGQRYKVQFTADQQLHDQIRQARDLLRHQVPDGDLATVLGKAMTLLVEKLKKQRFGHTDRPRRSNTGASTRSKSKTPAKTSAKAKEKSQPRSAPPRTSKGASALKPRADAATEPSNNRHIPAEVRRKVADRDGARCTFVSERGRRCEATGMLEFQHDDPFARGGQPTVQNLRLLCRAHNGLLAERDFGRDFIVQMRHGNRVNHRTVPGPSPD